MQGQVFVGEEARAQAHSFPENTFYSVKRLIGTRLDDVSEDLQYAPFKAQAAPDGSTVLWCPARQSSHHPAPAP